MCALLDAPSMHFIAIECAPCKHSQGPLLGKHELKGHMYLDAVVVGEGSQGNNFARLHGRNNANDEAQVR